MTDIAHEPWVEVARFAERADVDGYALALNAIGISCRLIALRNEFALLVAGADADRARRELVEYDRENPRLVPLAASSPFDGSTAALAYCAVLIFTFAASDRNLFGLDWWSAGTADAGRIVGGEWWRTITALGLHADLGHLAGNMFAGSVFALLLSPSLGPGLAWLTILLAAAVANGMNALIQPAGHVAVGASTAVFAALGLLSAMTWRRQASRWARGLRRWVPLGAGAMLLAYLGMGGERTDIAAHVLGFAVGVGVGAALPSFVPTISRRPGPQAGFGLGAFALFWLAWFLAFGIA